MPEPFVCVNGIDLEAGLNVYNRYRNGSRDFDGSPDMVEQLVAAALGERIPATVEEYCTCGYLKKEHGGPKSYKPAAMSHYEGRKRFVSAWQPVRTDSE